MSPQQARASQTPDSLVDIERYLKSQLAVIVAGFHSNPGMTEKSVQNFVQSFKSYQQDVLYVALHRIIYHLEYINQSCEHLTAFLDMFKTILEKCLVPLETIHRRYKHFTAAGTYIAPVPVYLTTENVPTRTGSRGKAAVAQFIPTRLLLSKLLSIPGMLKAMKEFVQSTEDPDGGVRHFMHSPNWKEMVRRVSSGNDDSITWLPLHIYFDEFEAGNPLGSRAGTNKLGAVYISLPSLPYRFASQIKFIFLMMLFKASDKGILRVDVPDECSNNVIVGNSVFKRVIEELNYLQEFGVEVQETPGTTATIKFLTGCLLGDNLGLNQICGFVESFSSRHCCRVCTDDYREAPFIEDPSSLRNAQNYAHDLELDAVSQTGIKEKCVWLDVKGFDLFANTNPDHMHDFLEGACYYVMYEVIKGLKDTVPNFTISNLNTRIKNFAFGPESNVPKEVNLVKDQGGGGRLRKMSANEVRVFVNYFGLLVGDLVSEFDEDLSTGVVDGDVVEYESLAPGYKYYDLYLKLIRVQDLLTCRNVNAAVAHELRTAVELLLTAYLDVSNRVHVPPKMHFLIHYATAMLRNGPSISLSSMTFEKKHRQLKRALTSIASTVNTPLSAAKKIMLLVNSLLIENELPPNTFLPGRLYSVSRSVVDPLRAALHLPVDVLFKSVKTIDSPLSITYSIGTIVCSGFSDDPILGCLPRFLKIVSMFYSGPRPIEKAVALAQPFKTMSWARHFNAYHVRRIHSLDAAEWVDLSTLEFPFPNTLCAAPNGNDYIYMRNSTSHFIY